MSPMYKAEFFGADCRHCRRSFAIPLLGDFSYGSFVLVGEKGDVFGYLSTFDCPLWDDIKSRLLTLTGQKDFKSRADIDRFQNVIAGCADTIQGQSLGLEFVCPFCRSRSVEYGDTKPLETRNIPVVSFTRFLSLQNSEKKQLLTELWSR